MRQTTSFYKRDPSSGVLVHTGSHNVDRGESTIELLWLSNARINEQSYMARDDLDELRRTRPLIDAALLGVWKCHERTILPPGNVVRELNISRCLYVHEGDLPEPAKDTAKLPSVQSLLALSRLPPVPLDGDVSEVNQLVNQGLLSAFMPAGKGYLIPVLTSRARLIVAALVAADLNLKPRRRRMVGFDE